MSRHTNAKYVRKTEGARREPGGLLCAVLTCVNDGDSLSYKIAERLGTSGENVYGALTRLVYRGYVEPIHETKVHWQITDAGRAALQNMENWL